MVPLVIARPGNWAFYVHQGHGRDITGLRFGPTGNGSLTGLLEFTAAAGILVEKSKNRRLASDRILRSDHPC